MQFSVYILAIVAKQLFYTIRFVNGMDTRRKFWRSRRTNFKIKLFFIVFLANDVVIIVRSVMCTVQCTAYLYMYEYVRSFDVCMRKGRDIFKIKALYYYGYLWSYSLFYYCWLNFEMPVVTSHGFITIINIQYTY